MNISIVTRRFPPLSVVKYLTPSLRKSRKKLKDELFTPIREPKDSMVKLLGEILVQMVLILTQWVSPNIIIDWGRGGVDTLIITWF